MANDPLASPPLIAAEPAGSRPTIRASRLRSLSASETPISELAVPMPWQNARTSPRLCSQTSRPSWVSMPRDRVRVVELIGRVGARLLRQLPRALDHVADVLSGHVPAALDGRDQLDLRAEGAHQLHPLLAEAFGDDDPRAIALAAADERECRAGAAARVLHDRCPLPQQAVAFRALEHRQRRAVLHRAGRVAVLELHPDLGAALRRDALQSHERRVSDRIENPGCCHRLRAYSCDLSARI